MKKKLHFLKNKVEIENKIKELDLHYRIVDCRFIQDSYQRQRNYLTWQLEQCK